VTPTTSQTTGAATLRIGTRGSALALSQSGRVGTAVSVATDCVVELVRIRTEGDVNAGPLATIGGTGVFVTAIRTALHQGRVDAVVHSFKDLPTAPEPGLRAVAVPVREDPADALCARDGLTLGGLPTGARVGTGSPRRRAQLLAIRPDLVVEPIRGNVDSRLRAVDEGRLDAVVLAMAGLTRLGRTDAATQRLAGMLPAPAQGALVVECRADDTAWYVDALTDLDHGPSRWAALAERALLAALEAGCTAPVGAIGTFSADLLGLSGAVIAADGSSEVRGYLEAPVSVDAGAADLGTALAADLLERGAADLLGAP